MKSEGVYSCIPTRYVVAALCFLAVTLQYTAKLALSVAIVAMVQRLPSNSSTSEQLDHGSTESEELDVCPGGGDGSHISNEEGEFDWSEATQGYILSGYFYGYIATQLLGGRLSEIFGSKVVIGPGIFITGVLTVLSPVAARLGVGFLIADRVLTGAASGVIIPAVHSVLAKWFVPEERNFIGSFILTGASVGPVISMVLSGFLASAGGWPLAFYLFGGITAVFIVPWIFLMYDSPEKHPRISEKEKCFILSGTGHENGERQVFRSVPWFSILTSVPFWAHVLMSLGNLWCFYLFLSELPTYLSNILHYNLEESGALSAMPNIFASVASVVSGYLSQCLFTKGYFSKLTTYRIFNTISAVIPAISLLAVTLVGCNSTAILVLLVCTVTFGSAYLGGSIFNHIDLANNYSGTLGGINSMVQNTGGILAPTVTGHIINEQQTLSQWKIVFYIAIAITTVPWLVYLVFGSVEEQPWNKLSAEEEKNEESSQSGTVPV